MDFKGKIDQHRSQFAANKADALGAWAHEALGSWGVLNPHTFKAARHDVAAEHIAKIDAMLSKGQHSLAETHLLKLWKHEIRHWQEVRECLAATKEKAPDLNETFKQHFTARLQGSAPYRLPADLEKIARTPCPSDPIAESDWLEAGIGIVLRLEWRLYRSGLQWDWKHFTEVVQPWAIAALDAYEEAITPHLREQRDHLLLWLGVWLVWSEESAQLEPIARKLASLLPSLDKYWRQQVAHELDLWEQKTGITLGVDHGGKAMLVGSLTRGWKRPRTTL